jgi:hypothetical protein
MLRTGQNTLCTENYFIVQQNKEQTLSHNAVKTCIIVHRNQFPNFHFDQITMTFKGFAIIKCVPIDRKKMFLPSSF